MQGDFDWQNLFEFNVTEGVFQFQPMKKLSCADDWLH